MKLPAYPRTKPSGVEWLGDVPEHWDVKRLDFLATVKARLGWKGLTADEYVPEGFIFLATPNIKGEGDIDFKNVNYITAERYYESPEIMVRVGDVLMAKDGSTLGTTNVVRHLPAATTVNSSIAVLRAKLLLDSSYFFRWLTSCYLQSLIQSMKDGQGVPHLFQADIRKFPLLLPSPTEQRAIAAFLDRETERVDRLVAKKRELIERLKEKRTALISRTVTRGLPPAAARAAGLPENPPLKASALDWLGDIPAHWSLDRHSRYFRSWMGQMILKEDLIDDGDVPVYSATESGAIFGYINNPAVELEAGDIVIPARGVSIGFPLLVKARSTCTQTTIYSKLMNSARVHSPYVFYWMVGFRDVLFYYDRTAIPQITVEQVSSNALLLPPLSEQAAIAAYLDEETAKLDALVGKVEEAVERLQEYRTALITAAVTGKIDVRHSPNTINP